MCSSARYSVGSPFFPFTATGTTSSWNTHASQACLARCCDASATSSTSFRASLYFSARPSAVSAIDGAERDRREVFQRAPEGAEAGPDTREEHHICIGTLGLHWGEAPRETRGISGRSGEGGRARGPDVVEMDVVPVGDSRLKPRLGPAAQAATSGPFRGRRRAALK